MTMATPTTPTAYEALSRGLAALLARDRQPPCCDGSGRWIAEDEDIRAEAAEECHGCALLAPCAQAGESECWGIWAGADRSVRPTRRRDRKAS